MFNIQSAGAAPVHVNTLAEVVAVLNDLACYGLSTDGLAVTNAQQKPLEILARDGALGLRLRGEPLAVLLALLADVEAFVRPGGAAARMPWQLLRQQWHAVASLVSIALDLSPCFDQPVKDLEVALTMSDGTPIGGTLAYVLGRVINARFGYRYEGPAFDSRGATSARHEVHLLYALALGKTVPEDVIAQSRAMDHRHFEPILVALLERPFLRGRMHPTVLDPLLHVFERKGKQQITADNVEAVVEALRNGDIATAQSARAVAVAVDDALYNAGLLPALPADTDPVFAKPPEEPLNELAAELAKQLHASRVTALATSVDETRAKRHMSLREHAHQLASAQEHGLKEVQKRANTLVKALQDRDASVLLAILDTPPTRNRTSKRFAQDRFGLRTVAVSAAERHANIVRYCQAGASSRPVPGEPAVAA